jgi:hypothetical protein
MLRANERLDAEFEQEGWPVYKTRFGLHLGEAVVGNIGSVDRMNTPHSARPLIWPRALKASTRTTERLSSLLRLCVNVQLQDLYSEGSIKYVPRAL